MAVEAMQIDDHDEGFFFEFDEPSGKNITKASVPKLTASQLKSDYNSRPSKQAGLPSRSFADSSI